MSQADPPEACEASTNVAKGTDRTAYGVQPEASEVATARPTGCTANALGIIYLLCICYAIIAGFHVFYWGFEEKHNKNKKTLCDSFMSLFQRNVRILA